MGPLHPSVYTNPEKKLTRAGFGDALVELGERNPNVVALTADLMESVSMSKFAEKFPDRFFDMGVAEQNMVAAAAGLALVGKIPFAATFGVFMPDDCSIRSANPCATIKPTSSCAPPTPA